MGSSERVTMSNVRDACDTILGSAIAAQDSRVRSRECAEGTAYEFEDPAGVLHISDYAGVLAVKFNKSEPPETVEIEFPFYSSTPDVTKTVVGEAGNLSLPIARQDHDTVAAELMSEVYRLAS